MTITCLLILPMIGFNAVSLDEKGALQPPRKELLVRRVVFESHEPTFDEIARTLDAAQVPFHVIACSWEAFPYRPETRFRIAYDDEALYLQYQVREKYLLARCEHDDDACWPSNDSCVEFFVSPGSDLNYTNIEFSCIGYCLIESGAKGTKRSRLPREITSQVRRKSTLGSQPFEHREGDFAWSITIAIPLSFLTPESGAALSGKTWKANFYKCGDELPEKAYLAWSPVRVPGPAFHHPEEFGTLVFE